MSKTLAPPTRSHRVPPALIAFVWLASGGNFAAFALGVQAIPPFLLTSSRMILGGGLMLLLVYLFGRFGNRKGVVWPSRRQIMGSAVMAFLMLILAQTSVVWSVQKLPAGVAAIESASMPIWVCLMGALFFGEKPSARVSLGIALGFAGLLILFFARRGGTVDEVPILPASVTLIGAIGGGAGIIYGRRADLPQNCFINTGIQLLVAGIAIFALSLAAGEWTAFRPEKLTLTANAAWLYMLVVSSMLGFPGLVWVARHAKPAVASTFAYVGPVVGIAASVGLLGEHLTVTKLIAATLALGGAILMVSERRTSMPPELSS